MKMLPVFKALLLKLEPGRTRAFNWSIRTFSTKTYAGVQPDSLPLKN